MSKRRISPVVALLGPFILASCGKEKPALTGEVVVAAVSAVAEKATDPAWSELPEHRAPLLLQDLVEPRLLVPSTAEVRARAMSDGRWIAIRLAWSDSTRDDLPGAARFSDACAIQFPAEATADLPAPQMGETGRRVEISYWRASWQATLDGREDEIRALYPGAHPDHYPFEAPPLDTGSSTQREAARRYAPARALDNAMEGPRSSSVEDLVAEGPGTITAAKEQRSVGSGTWTEDGWIVVIKRPIPHSLGAGERGQVAFAVWNGGRDETGSRKMRTGWVPLVIRAWR